MKSSDEIDREDVHAVPGGGRDSTWRGRELAFGCGDLRFQIVDTAGAGIAARLAPSLPARMSLSSDATVPPDVRYVVEAWQPGWGARRTGYRISRDGTLRYLGGSPDRVVQWLRADIDENMARRSRAGLVFQAAVVVWRERAILIPGRGSGTSTLAAELARQGATLGSDGLAVLDDEGRWQPDVAGPLPVAVALIVSTTYRPEASRQPRRLRGARAVLPIIDSALPERNEPRRVLRLSARLAATVLTLQGPRPDASIAAARILAVLDEWLDGRAQAAPTAPAPGLLSQARHALARARRGPVRVPGKRPPVG